MFDLFYVALGELSALQTIMSRLKMILTARHQLQMLDIDASLVVAQVPNIHAFRHIADTQQISQHVCMNGATCCEPLHCDAAISVVVGTCEHHTIADAPCLGV